MLSLTVIFSIIIIHWFADFVMQTDKQAKGKSKNWKDLLSHTITYSFTWLVIGYIIGFLKQNQTESINYLIASFWFFLVTFITHTITDYFTSRLNAKLWAKGDVHNFFVSIGFDQILHYVQLFLTYWILTN